MSRRAALAWLASSAVSLSLARAAAAEPKTVWGIAELYEWLYLRQQSSGRDSADCLQAHLDQGIRHVMWHLGRSTLDYHSSLPTSSLYAGDTRPETRVIAEAFRKECSLRAALAFAAANGMTIYGRLAMNRHYGAGYGGGLRSKYIAEHPEWQERDRQGRADETRMSYAVPEYRAERIAILTEAARIGAHGLCLDFCRQPPLVRYHPLVLEPWLAKGKPDPRQSAPGTPEFLEWARYRCGYVTQCLRDLRAELRKVEQATGRKVPVLARVTEATHDLNLMEGIDLATWLEERLIDEIALDPFVLWKFAYPETARPYVELARRHGVRILGGVNTTPARGTKTNARAFLERVERNYREGVDGLALYQTDAPIHEPRLKAILGPLLPKLSEPAAVAAILAEARETQPELTDQQRFFGLDNHSKLEIFGHAPGSLETI